jgi:3-methyladenine DNA glycosylase Tag
MGNCPLMVEYHDKEWGVPVHDDRTLFEFLVLEGAQAGLSWQTVLNKRENYRKAFHGFEPAKSLVTTAKMSNVFFATLESYATVSKSEPQSTMQDNF